MKRRIVWLVVSSLMVLALLAASCAPAVEEVAPTAPTAPTTPTVPTAPTTPTAPKGPEMVKVSLKKLDGTVVEKMVEKPRYGGELILVSSSPVPISSWDAAFTGSSAPQGPFSPTGEELIVGDWWLGPAGTGEVTWQLGTLIYYPPYMKGALAESWEIVQPDTIIYHIRKGVHFGLNPALEPSRLVGGREVTGEDVLWNIKRLFFEYKTSSVYLVSGVSRPLDAYAPDKWTVVVKAPEGQLWRTLQYVSGYWKVDPPEIAKKYGDFTDWTRKVGTDAFLIKDYVAMSQITWVRNPNYWGKDFLFPENQLPYIDTLKLLIIPDASTRMSAMRTGKIDQLTGLLWEDAASLQKTNPELKYTKKYGRTHKYSGRLDKPELPFKDIRVRRALMMAINHQELTDTYFGGKGNAEVFAFPVAPSKEYLPAFTPLEELGLAPDGFDTKKLWGYYPEEAKKLLAEAGYPNGFKTEVLMDTGGEPPFVDVASIFKAYWAKIGVDLALDVKEPTVVRVMYVNKTYKEIYVHTGWDTQSVFFNLDGVRTGNVMNFPMIVDPKIEAYYARMTAAVPLSAEYWSEMKAVNLYIIHRAFFITSPTAYSWDFWQPWLKGYSGETGLGGIGMAYDLDKYIWIDQALKKARGR